MISLNPRLHWHRLDADFVAFHRDSGNTFLANGMAARIFAALTAGPLADDELVRAICTGDAEIEARRVFDASLSFLKDLDAVVTDAAN